VETVMKLIDLVDGRFSTILFTRCPVAQQSEGPRARQQKAGTPSGGMFCDTLG
jgi:hypothetical protein